MRFEIKSGGAFLILVGLIGLSGAVFALGLVAGYEMGRQNQPDLSTISSTYPLPASPEVDSTPASAAQATPAVASLPSVSAPRNPALPASGANPASRIPLPAAARTPLPVAARPSPAAIARVRPPVVSPPPISPPAAESSAPADEDEAIITPPAPNPAMLAPPHKPFNIQIEAVMDKSGADEMIARLRSLGYNAQGVTQILGGETWYRVRIGPYNTEAEAKAAQDRLREQYKQAYSTSH
jgi:cell division septation protein DedD